MDRNQLVALRPLIKKAKVNESTNAIEQFQNETLRPIIKLQHELWIAWLQLHLKKYKINLKDLEMVKQMECIQSLIGKEKDIKNQCVGMVCGHFTLEEFAFYQTAIAAINKRIVIMVIERLQSVLPLAE